MQIKTEVKKGKAAGARKSVEEHLSNFTKEGYMHRHFGISEIWKNAEKCVYLTLMRVALSNLLKLPIGGENCYIMYMFTSMILQRKAV